MLKAKSSFGLNFSALKNPKVLSFIVFFFILLVLPFTLFEVKQQQQLNQHAASQVPYAQTYNCGTNLTIILSVPTESPNCTGNSGYFPGLTSFQSTVTIKAQPGSVGAYLVKWAWAQYFCTTEDPHVPCLQNLSVTNSTSDQEGLTGNNVAYVTARSSVRSASGQFSGQDCGYYQNDFGFQIYDKTNLSRLLCGVS